MLMRAILLALLATGWLSEGQAQQPPPGITVHRSEAGVLDGSGWTRAESTTGAFSAQLPCRFDDIGAKDDNPQSPITRVDSLSCVSADRSKLSVMRIQYRRGMAGALEFLERRASLPPWPNATVTRSSFRGLPLVETSATDARSCVISRLLFTAPDNLVMTIEAPAANCPIAEAVSRKFFESFVLRPH